MTNPHDRIEEGRRLLNGYHDLHGPVDYDAMAEWLVENANLLLHTLPSELESAHARIAALEATPAPAEDVVERVARAIWRQHGYIDGNFDGKGDPFRRLSWEELLEMEGDYCPTATLARNQAHAALSALPLDYERIREIRERHEAVHAYRPFAADWDGKDADGLVAHSDRAFLLQQISNLGDENGD